MNPSITSYLIVIFFIITLFQSVCQAKVYDEKLIEFNKKASSGAYDHYTYREYR